jgi:5,10-methylenetetrahydromethanopterin reductase
VTGRSAVALLVTSDGMNFPDAVDYAVSLEDAGFESVWFPEIAREPFVGLAAVAARTSRLGIGTAVANWARSPVVSALTAANLHDISDGRFRYGLGVGPPHFNANLHGISYERPVARLADYVRVLRGIWAAEEGQPFSHDGEYFRVKDYVRERGGPVPVPLYLAAVQGGMLELAGAVAQGVLFNICTTPKYYREVALPRLAAGARRAGRDVAGIDLTSVVVTSVDADAATARERSRRHIAAYAPLPYFDQIFRLHGFEAEAARIRAAAAAGDLKNQVAEVTDAMVEILSVSGTPDAARDRVACLGEVLDRVILMSPSFLTGDDEIVANLHALRECFATA